MFRLAAQLGTVAFILSFNFAVQAQSKLPEGKGKDLVERECAKCHTLQGVVSAHMSKERWSAIVDDMVSRGANGTDQEINVIVDYLAMNFGSSTAGTAAKINVNRATAGELAAALQVAEQDASAIVQYRQKNGEFKGLDDLKKVPGLDSKRIEEKKDHLEF